MTDTPNAQRVRDWQHTQRGAVSLIVAVWVALATTLYFHPTWRTAVYAIPAALWTAILVGMWRDAAKEIRRLQRAEEGAQAIAEFKDAVAEILRGKR